MPTAVVIGSGPNGLAGAVTLAQAGFDVVVHEEQPTLGGGTRSAELTLPGFVHDLCSAIHPLARSPFFREVDLQLDWVEPPLQAAHPFDDGTAAVLHRDVGETARGLGADERAYRRLFEPVVEHWDAVEPILVGPHPPPPRRVLAMLRALGPRNAAHSARVALAPARSAAEKAFSTRRGGRSSPGTPPIRCCRSKEARRRVRIRADGARPRLWVGLPARWLAANCRRSRGAHQGARRRGAHVEPRRRAARRGRRPRRRHARDLLRMAAGRLPARYARALERYRHGPGAFKLDWALDGPIPWRAEECGRAATVHLGGTLEEIAASESEPWNGRHAERPFVLLAQQSLFDDTRAPAGKHTAWAYCHVPNGSTEDMTARDRGTGRAFRPGFRRARPRPRVSRARPTSRRGTATSSAATSTAAPRTSRNSSSGRCASRFRTARP